ncbi:hypothetical protein C440_13769 [Haloferax mucosum ATCC BAA-1512]|uniref:Uncharacterized protein n=2 Tax=Haloferax mucosum TaxID=403181 RepID=M0I3P7_9EURY|nr:hypothetical protein C440_13769 [Haloferax mucosum ATCC BAA-1512]
MIIRHFGEHPAFDCRIASRNPLAGEKESGDSDATETIELVAD